ncbi:hypothetical protein N7523_008443 [Penicillium sp. IBT 18751x]|nr:hypothetical protein N7523_008443 [Penicillium sp. IBT 18751x]
MEDVYFRSPESAFAVVRGGHREEDLLALNNGVMSEWVTKSLACLIGVTKRRLPGAQELRSSEPSGSIEVGTGSRNAMANSGEILYSIVGHRVILV